MKVLITQPRGKEKLAQAFASAGAKVVTKLDPEVKLIVPTVDEELPFFAHSRDYFMSKGIRVMVAGDYTIDMCRDKSEFARFCRRHEFGHPDTMQGKVIAKARFGKGSRGQILIDKSYVIQEYIDWPEYSIDYFADWNGTPLSIVPRERLKVVNGEATEARIIYDDKLVDKATEIAADLYLVGHNVIQCFYDGHNVLFTEVNPRFGGGSWLTFKEFNSPLWLMRNL